ncbi:MAG: hypothetical protein ACI9N1_003026 [Flavobacteriales bacterium]|jgi:hypothetical protein
MIKSITVIFIFLISKFSYAQDDLDSLFADSDKGVKHLVEVDLGAMLTHGLGLHVQYGRMVSDRTRLIGGIGFSMAGKLTDIYSPSKAGPTITLGLRKFGNKYDPLFRSYSFISGIKYRFTYNTAVRPNDNGALRSFVNTLTPYIGYGLFYPKLEISAIFGLGFGRYNIVFDDNPGSGPTPSGNLNFKIEYPRNGFSFEFGPKIGYKF